MQMKFVQKNFIPHNAKDEAIYSMVPPLFITPSLVITSMSTVYIDDTRSRYREIPDYPYNFARIIITPRPFSMPFVTCLHHPQALLTLHNTYLSLHSEIYLIYVHNNTRFILNCQEFLLVYFYKDLYYSSNSLLRILLQNQCCVRFN